MFTLAVQLIYAYELSRFAALSMSCRLDSRRLMCPELPQARYLPMLDLWLCCRSGWSTADGLRCPAGGVGGVDVTSAKAFALPVQKLG